MFRMRMRISYLPIFNHTSTILFNTFLLFARQMSKQRKREIQKPMIHQSISSHHDPLCFQQIGVLDVVYLLKKTINKKWTAQQYADYSSFLENLESFVYDSLLHRLYNHEQFFDTIKCLKEGNINGSELCQSQIKYLENKQQINRERKVNTSNLSPQQEEDKASFNKKSNQKTESEQKEPIDNLSEVNVESEPFQQYSKTFMLYFDQYTYGWALHPYFADKFSMHFYIVKELRVIINEKWTVQQKAAYIQFLNDLQTYITDYVFNKLVHYHEDFLDWVEKVKQFNPVGVDLYEKQLVQFQKIMERRDLIQKRKSKNNKNIKQLGKNAGEHYDSDPQQQNEPDVDIQKLYKCEWDTEKYMNINIIRKEHINIALIGQNNSGKSSLAGRIVSLLQQQNLPLENQEKIDYSNFSVLDKQDGRKRVSQVLKQKRFTVFDFPGHNHFTSNLIEILNQTQVTVLLISAKEGEFESYFNEIKMQAMIMRAAGIHQLVVVITKMGIVFWNKKRFNFIKGKMTSYLNGECGFETIAYIPIDSIQATNIHHRVADSWYKGPCFLECLENAYVTKRDPSGPLRVIVNDKINIDGTVYLYCVVQSGTIIENHNVTIHPERKKLIIKKIYSVKDERLPFATAGENVKIKVKGVDKGDFSKGSIICNKVNSCSESTQFTTKIVLVNLPEHKRLLTSGYKCSLHVHALVAQVEVAKVLTRKKKNFTDAFQPNFLLSGEYGTCILKLKKPISLQLFTIMPRLGSFFLMDEGKIIGHGEITAIKQLQEFLREKEEKDIKRKLALKRQQQEALKKMKRQQYQQDSMKAQINVKIKAPIEIKVVKKEQKKSEK